MKIGGLELQVKGEDKVMAPEEVSSMVLTKMKETAENYLGASIDVLMSKAKDPLKYTPLNGSTYMELHRSTADITPWVKTHQCELESKAAKLLWQRSSCQRCSSILHFEAHLFFHQHMHVTSTRTHVAGATPVTCAATHH